MAINYGFSFWLASGFFAIFLVTTNADGGLYPRESPSREIKTLDGIWNFDTNSDFKTSIDMPVPASYNDMTTERSIRDLVGVVWYKREFQVPSTWKDSRVWIRFGSVCYAAQVWINNQSVVDHQIGHLPFQVELTNVVKFGAANQITVAVNNTLDQYSIPQGSIYTMTVENKVKTVQSYTFDFFNFAGIDRPVILYTTPKIYIKDISIDTKVNDDLTEATVTYKVEYDEGNIVDPVQVHISLIDREGNVIIEDDKLSEIEDTILLRDPKLWWPYLMDSDPGYLYTLQVRTSAGSPAIEDIYRQPFGFRQITWDDKQVYINGKPIYIRGVGKHEDFDIKGKGLDLSVIVKDFNLMKWAGINSFRTSHYPYSEEMMDLADRHGFIVIDECPSVNTELFSDTLLKNHKQSLNELISRDKNRPSVIFWSIANEPRVSTNDSAPYFKNVSDFVKTLDKSRPITAAIDVVDDKIGDSLDVYAFNRYYSWYTNGGQLEVIKQNIETTTANLYNKYKKPLLITEYGADTWAGQHALPETMWSEEYQTKMLSEHFKAFDNVRSQGYFIGEMIWAFADFATGQVYTRAGGNKKGIFTRQRNPKRAAFLVRQRYLELAKELNGIPLPDDLYQYSTVEQTYKNHTEL